VDVIRHQAVAEKLPSLPGYDRREQIRIGLVIVIVDEDPPSVYAPAVHVIGGAWFLGAQTNSHAN
jgi:hypothetical protein